MEDVVARAILDGFETAMSRADDLTTPKDIAEEIRRGFPACPLSDAQLEGVVHLLLGHYLAPTRPRGDAPRRKSGKDAELPPRGRTPSRPR